MHATEEDRHAMHADSEPTPEPEDHRDASLRGTFVMVMLMGAFFVACWFGLLALALERR